MHHAKTIFSPIRVLAMLFTAMLVLSGCSSDDEADAPVNIDSFIANAKESRSKGQFQAAIIESRNAIQAAPGDQRPYREMAKTMLEIGQQRQAIKTLEPITEPDAQTALVLVKAYIETGKVRSAGELLNSAILEGERGSIEYRHLQAMITFAQRDFEGAADLFSDLIPEEPSNADLHLGLIGALLAQSDIPSARDKLNELLAIDPQNSDAFLILSRLEQQAGDLVAEEEYLMQAIGSLKSTDIITPVRYSILVGLRDNLTKQGKTSEALLYAGLIAETIPSADVNQQQIQAAIELLEQGDYEEARAQLDEIIGRSPGAEQATTLLALIDYLQGDDEAASLKFENVIDPETSSPVALQLFAVTELRLNQPEKVIERLSKDIDASNDSKLNALYAVALASSDRLEESEKYFKKSIVWEPENGRLYLPLARLYNQLGRPDEALTTIKTGFEKQPEETLVQRSLIAQLISMDRGAEASSIVEDIQKQFPDDQNVALLAANYYLQTGDLKKGEKALEKVLKLGPSVIAEHQKARIQLQKKEFDKALASYTALIGKNSEDENAYKGLMTAYELKDESSKGVDELKTIYSKNKSNALALVLSEYFGRNGDLAQAEYWLSQYSGETTPQQVRLAESLIISQARASLADGESENGLSILTEGLEKYPDSSRILASIVTLKINDDELEEANSYLNLLENISDEPIVNVLKGDLELAKGNLLAAKEAYSAAWERTPNDQIAFKLFSVLQSAKRTPEEIGEFLDEWLQKIPQSQVAGVTRAGFHYSIGNLETAKTAYQALIEANPNNVIAHNNLAWIYSDAEADKALISGEIAYKLAPTRPEIMDTYGWFLLKNGQAAKAAEVLREAVKLAPDNAEIVGHLKEAEAAL